VRLNGSGLRYSCLDNRDELLHDLGLGVAVHAVVTHVGQPIGGGIPATVSGCVLVLEGLVVGSDSCVVRSRGGVIPGAGTVGVNKGVVRVRAGVKETSVTEVVVNSRVTTEVAHRLGTFTTVDMLGESVGAHAVVPRFTLIEELVAIGALSVKSIGAEKWRAFGITVCAVVVDPLVAGVEGPVLAETAETLASIATRSGEDGATVADDVVALVGALTVESNTNVDGVVLGLLAEARLGLLAAGHDVDLGRWSITVADDLGGTVEGLVDITSQEEISIAGAIVVNVLLTSVEEVRDLSALVVEAEVLLTLADGEGA